MPPPAAPYVSASDLADYAYCPRSHWYRHHPPDGDPDPESLRRSEAGVRFHRRTLRSERTRAHWGPAYWVLVVAGLIVAAAGVLWWL